MCRWFLLPGEFLIFQQDSTDPHRVCDNVWFLEQATSEFISRYQTAATSFWWHTLSGASLMACLPVVCWKCQWIEAASAGRLVRHGTYYWQCSDNEWCISEGSVATLLRFGGNFYIRFVGNFILFPMVEEFWKSVRTGQSYWQHSTPPCFLRHRV